MTSPDHKVLDALPENAVIVDASGLAHQKHNGKWKAWFDKYGCSSKLMLDPEKARQPLRVVFVS